MFGFESGKILTRVFIIIFCVLFAFYMLLTYLEISSEFSYKQTYKSKSISELYDSYLYEPDVVTQEYETLMEQIELLNSENDNAEVVRSLTEHYYLYAKLFQDINRKEQYIEETSSVIRQAKYHLLAYDKENVPKTSYNYKYQLSIDSLFTNAQNNISFGFEHYTGWDSYFNDQNPSAYIYILLCGYLVLHFFNDKRHGNDNLIYPTKNGKWKYLIIKYLTHNVILIICIILCELSRLCVVYLHHGLSSPLNNIQVFSCFTMNPYDITILQYFILYLTVKFVISLLMFSTGVLICLVCSHIPIFIVFYIGNISIIALIHTLTDGTFGSNGLFEVHSFLQKYRTVNLFGTIVYAPLFYFLFCIIGIIISYVLLLCFYFKRSISIRTFSFSSIKINHRNNRSISCFYGGVISHEFYKQFIHGRKWLVLLSALLLMSFIQWNICNTENTYMESLYQEHIVLVEGMYSEEKEMFIRQQYMAILDTISIESEMRIKYQNKQISLEEYREYIQDFTSASTAQYIYLDLINKTESLKEYQTNSGKIGYYLYEKGYQLFNSSDLYMFYILLLIIFCGTAFLPEYTSKNNAVPMIALIRTSKGGIKQLQRTKYSVYLFTNILLYTMMSIYRFIIIGKIFPFRFIMADIRCVSGFEQLPYSISIHLFYVLFFLYQLFIIIVITALLLVIGKICKYELHTLISLLVLALPILLRKIFSHAIISAFDLSMLFQVSHFTSLLKGNVLAILSSVIFFGIGIFSIVFLCKTHHLLHNKPKENKS